MTQYSDTPHNSSSVQAVEQAAPATPPEAAPAIQSSGSLHGKTYLALMIMTIAGPVGNVLLASGMKHIGKVTFQTPSQVFETFLRVFATPTIWLGIGSLIAFFVVYMLLLSWADYSFVQPASSIAYAVVALLGYFVLGESVSPLRWVGIGIICLGVFVVGSTHPQTAGRS